MINFCVIFRVYSLYKGTIWIFCYKCAVFQITCYGVTFYCVIIGFMADNLFTKYLELATDFSSCSQKFLGHV